ncbi:MAG: hypothetical protein OEW13_13135, partial [Nitrospira sp.]|nr:hypothetical protein [Nitrospira sp.]
MKLQLEREANTVSDGGDLRRTFALQRVPRLQVGDDGTDVEQHGDPQQGDADEGAQADRPGPELVPEEEQYAGEADDGAVDSHHQ